MRVVINGEERELPEGTTVSQMLETLKVVPERVVVEVNLAILKRAQLPGAVLKEGDRVEVVHFVGGGSSGNAKPVTGNQKPDKSSGYSERVKRARRWQRNS
jgi:thiamine biosynthesis protein ThiS